MFATLESGPMWLTFHATRTSNRQTRSIYVAIISQEGAPAPGSWVVSSWPRWVEATHRVLEFSSKEAMKQLGPWQMSLGGAGECLPYYENRVE